jgi:hypothetical protein
MEGKEERKKMKSEKGLFINCLDLFSMEMHKFLRNNINKKQKKRKQRGIFIHLLITAPATREIGTNL